MTERIGPASWYVGAGEREAYERAADATGQRIEVIEGGALCQARNAAIRDAEAERATCVQVSDDLDRVMRATAKGKATAVPFADALRELLAALEEHPFYLAGCAPTANAYWFDPRRPVGFAHFIVGDLIALKPGHGLAFDEGLRLKEDYDLTLAAIRAHGGVVRANGLLPVFAHRSNAGGAVTYRTEQAEEEAIARLTAKWGPCLRRNPRRAHEILLDARPLVRGVRID